MKNYITTDKYVGLDPRIVELFKLGKKIYGYYYDRNGGDKQKGELVDYCHGKNFPFRILEDNGCCNEFTNFEPIFKNETDWSKVPIDTKILVWMDEGGKVKRHFAGLAENGGIKGWLNGGTSWTSKGIERVWTWDNAEIYKEDK